MVERNIGLGPSGRKVFYVLSLDSQEFEFEREVDRERERKRERERDRDREGEFAYSLYAAYSHINFCKELKVSF